MPSEILTNSQLPTTEPTPKSKTKLWPITACAAFTFALCSIVFGLWTLRQIYQVQNENKILQKNRSILISNIQKNNLEIKKLKSVKPEPVQRKIANTTKNKPKLSKPEPYHAPKIAFSISNGSVNKPQVALTFDGGYISNVANEILDTLLSRNVKASMFVTGYFIRKFPDIINRIVLEGHDLGNHTMSHPHLTSYAQTRTQTTLPQVNTDFLKKELVSAENLLLEKTGHKFSSLWRAPYGEFNNTICTWAHDLGYTHVGWRQGRTWRDGLDCNDWIPDSSTPGFKTPTEVFDKIMNIANTKPNGINGGIILLHLGTARKNEADQVHKILGTLIDSVRALGYTFVPVSQMLKNSDTPPVSSEFNLSESNKN